MRKKVERIFIAAAAALLVFSAAAKAENKPLDAQALFNSLRKHAGELKSYKVKFDFHVTPGKDRKEENRVCEFWFMGHDFMRLEVLSGDDKGAKVAYNAAKSKDKVRAKKGFLSLPLSIDDKRLGGFFKSDWKSDLDEIAGWMKGGSYKYLGKEKLKGRDANKLELTFGAAGSEHKKALLWIDAKDNVLLQYQYLGAKGDLQETKTWHDIILNAKQSADDFKP